MLYVIIFFIIIIIFKIVDEEIFKVNRAELKTKQSICCQYSSNSYAVSIIVIHMLSV